MSDKIKRSQVDDINRRNNALTAIKTDPLAIKKV